MINPNEPNLQLAGIVFLLCLATGCESETSASATPQVEAIPVETLEVKRVPFENTFETTAVALGTDRTTVSAESSGRIEHMNKAQGDRVVKGGRLFETDSAIDHTQLKLAKNRKQLAKSQYERTKNLVDEGVSTEQQLDRAYSSLQEARLNYRQLKQRFDKTTLKSPAAGVILHKLVDVGEYVAPGTPVVRLAKLDPIEFSAEIAESRLQYVAKGDSARITVPGVDKSFEAHVDDISPAADGPTRTFEIELRAPNPDHQIRPGMHAKVELTKSRTTESLVVPREAILLGVNRKEAMIAEQNKAVRRAVTTGPSRGPKLVVNEGLSSGDKLIVRGHRGISDGTRIEIVTEHTSLDGFLTQIAE